MDKFINQIGKENFKKFTVNLTGKTPEELDVWEYRECLSYFPFDTAVLESDLTIEQLSSIAKKIIKNQKFSWQSLSVSDEAILQRLIRDYGYELTCYNLNSFPTSTKEFQQIIVEPSLKEKIKNYFYKARLLFIWIRPMWITVLTILSIILVPIQWLPVFVVTYVLGATLATLGHNYVLHDTGLRFRNNVLQFIGEVLIYLYSPDVKPGGREFHNYHHRLWRTDQDPLVNEMKIAKFMYIFGLSTSKIQHLLSHDIQNFDKPSMGIKFITNKLSEYRWYILTAVSLIFILLFDYASWASYYLIPLWSIAVFYSRGLDYLFHGPHTWKNPEKTERDYPLMMPVMFSSAFHITHHYYPNHIYFGSGLWRYLNLEYWLTQLFFNIPKGKLLTRLSS